MRSQIEREIRYLPGFEGKPGTLPAFITSVDKALVDYGEEAARVFTVIYNEKITASAKNYLQTAPPETWTECKDRLKLHFRSSKEQGQIAQEIYSLKVSGISELIDKVRAIVNDIAECAIFSQYQKEISNHLGSLLVLRIKEITAGTLAAELYNKYSLTDIREILNKFIGQDNFNLKSYKSSFVPNNRSFSRFSENKPIQNQYRPSNNYGQYHT